MQNAELEHILGHARPDVPAWCWFDHEWYARAHPECPAELVNQGFAGVRRHYLDHGRALGCSPNPLFDERWYRLRHPAVAQAVAAGELGSGYEHYCASGYLSGSPHWLFDEALYANLSPDVTDQTLIAQDCFNPYDHYLRIGAREGRVAHLLFDPMMVAGAGADGAFGHFLRDGDRLAASSIYFDPVWYARRYPEVAEAVARGAYGCALHHYLAAPEAAGYDPRPDFSETFYRERNGDVAAGLRAGRWRNGHAHFLEVGVFELREPGPDVGLRAFAEATPRLQTALDEGRWRDAYAGLLHSRAARVAPPEPTAPARVFVALPPPAAGTGRVDYLGFTTPGHGWLFCGWVNPEHPAIDDAVTGAAYFEQGSIHGPALVSSFPRDDLESPSVGLLVYIEGSGRPLGKLISLSITGVGIVWTLFPGESVTLLRDEKLVTPVRQLLARLRGNAAKDALIAIAGRRGYTGANTIAELRDRVFLEIDETIFCPPRGLVLIGWKLAGPGVITSIRLHSGHNDMLLQPEQFLKMDRADVQASVGVPNGLPDLDCGFMLFVPSVFMPAESTYLAVETGRGEIGFRGIGEPRQRGMEAIRGLLERFDLRYEAMARGFDHVIGPAVASLNRERLRHPPAHDVLRFGAIAEAPVVSVILPLYGRMDFLEYQFALFSADRSALAHEFIYVLDDPARQREVEILAAAVFARYAIPFRVVLLARNMGFAPACNVGLSMAGGEFVCFMNSDVFPDTPGWMEALVARLRAHPEIGALGPLLLFEDRSVQHMGMVFEPLAEFAGWQFPRHERKGWRPPAHGGLHESAAITGACMMLSRRVARDLGGFDESYIIGDFEDADLCQRLAEQGLGCAVDLDVRMYHLERQSQAGPEQRWRLNLTLFNAWVHERRWGALLRERQAAGDGAVAARHVVSA
jgi:GT2 family glycosyltransferase